MVISLSSGKQIFLLPLKHVLYVYSTPGYKFFSFLQEITHFLMTDSSSSPLSRLEGLRLLRQSMENKHQLVDLVNGAEGKSLLLSALLVWRQDGRMASVFWYSHYDYDLICCYFASYLKRLTLSQRHSGYLVSRSQSEWNGAATTTFFTCPQSIGLCYVHEK